MGNRRYRRFTRNLWTLCPYVKWHQQNQCEPLNYRWTGTITSEGKLKPTWFSFSEFLVELLNAKDSAVYQIEAIKKFYLVQKFQDVGCEPVNSKFWYQNLEITVARAKRKSRFAGEKLASAKCQRIKVQNFQRLTKIASAANAGKQGVTLFEKTLRLCHFASHWAQICYDDS